MSDLPPEPAPTNPPDRDLPHRVDHKGQIDAELLNTVLAHLRHSVLARAIVEA